MSAALLNGCATLGETEALNDIGLGDVREVLNTVEKTRNVLGAKPTSGRATAARINRGYGHARNMQYSPREINDVPFVVRDVNELLRYLK